MRCRFAQWNVRSPAACAYCIFQTHVGSIRYCDVVRAWLSVDSLDCDSPDCLWLVYSLSGDWNTPLGSSPLDIFSADFQYSFLFALCNFDTDCRLFSQSVISKVHAIVRPTIALWNVG